jgi:cyclic pyranopterin phosphate synthase
MGAKKTSELIPLCHPIAITGVDLQLVLADGAIDISATVKTTDRTGVEMEAFTSVSVAALTIIDMIKAVDPTASITAIALQEKGGGKNGHWVRP